MQTPRARSLFVLAPCVCTRSPSLHSTLRITSNRISRTLFSLRTSYRNIQLHLTILFLNFFSTLLYIFPSQIIMQKFKQSPRFCEFSDSNGLTILVLRFFFSSFFFSLSLSFFFSSFLPNDRITLRHWRRGGVSRWGTRTRKSTRGA